MLASVITAHENSKMLWHGLLTRKEAVISFIPTPAEREVMSKDHNYINLVRLNRWCWSLFRLDSDQELERDFPDDGSEGNENRLYLIPGYSFSRKSIELMERIRDRLWPDLDVNLLIEAIEDDDSFSRARVTFTVGEWLSDLNTTPDDPDTIFGISKETYESLDQGFLNQIFE